MPEQPVRDDHTPSLYEPHGDDGQYVFADLDELDDIIAALDAEVSDLRREDQIFQSAIRLATPPADDHMSVTQVEAYRASLQLGRKQYRVVLAYAEIQLFKLRAARRAYAEADTTAAERLERAPGADE